VSCIEDKQAKIAQNANKTNGGDDFFEREKAAQQKQFLMKNEKEEVHMRHLEIIPVVSFVLSFSACLIIVIVKHSVYFLQASPLVYPIDEAGNLHPFDKLAHDKETALISRCFKEADRDIDLTFDKATSKALLKAVDRHCSCLHYSGHGYQKHLAFENGKGGPYWLGVENLRDLVKRTNGAPFKLVFVSACDSEDVGNTFVDAGVPHVVSKILK
jgi:hypothetical protein